MKDRKLKMSLLAMLLILIGACLVAYAPGFAASYQTYCVAILTAAGIFSASNAMVTLQAMKEGKPQEAVNEADKDTGSQAKP